MSKVINLFAGPGAGKSTLAAMIFAELKSHGHNAEIVLEFAKELTWEERFNILAYQPYVFGKQYSRIKRLVDAKVDYVIVDSPLMLSCVFQKDRTPSSFRQSVHHYFSEFDNYNYQIKREKPYLPKGRSQSEDEARDLDQQISDMLREYNIPLFPMDITSDRDGALRAIADFTDPIGPQTRAW